MSPDNAVERRRALSKQRSGLPELWPLSPRSYSKATTCGVTTCNLICNSRTVYAEW